MFQIYLKELRELSRDSRTLIFMIVLPTLLMPVLMGGFAYLAGSLVKKDLEQSLKYAIVGPENNQELASRLSADSQFSRIDLPAGIRLEEAIDKQMIRFALVLPRQTASDVSDGNAFTVDMYFNDASSTNSAYDRVKKVIDMLADDIRKRRLAALGLRGGALVGVTQPISLRRISTASTREKLGERLGSLVPYILILVCLSGAMYPALDLGVGEKERGTLETLLLTPVHRYAIILAKFLVLFTTGLLSVFLTIFSSTLWTLLALPSLLSDERSRQVLNTLSDISFFDVSMVLLMLVPVSAIFAAALLSLSIYARGYKEAQSYLSPIVLVSFMPLILAMLPGVRLSWGWAAVPLTNVALAIKEICKGTVDYTKVLVIFGSSTLVAAFCLVICTWWFQRESVLFRS